MVTVIKNLLSTYYKKQWKKKQKATVLVEQKIHATAKTVNVNVHVAKVENVHAKGNAHAAADAKHSGVPQCCEMNKKKKANNQYPERYQLLTFYSESIRNHRYNSSFTL